MKSCSIKKQVSIFFFHFIDCIHDFNLSIANVCLLYLRGDTIQDWRIAGQWGTTVMSSHNSSWEHSKTKQLWLLFHQSFTSHNCKHKEKIEVSLESVSDIFEQYLIVETRMSTLSSISCWRIQSRLTDSLYLGVRCFTSVRWNWSGRQPTDGPTMSVYCQCWYGVRDPCSFI